MRVFIQIPCLNEADTLPEVIRDLPREIPGIEEIYTLVIDDGSVDATVEIAKRVGIDYILHNSRNIGLAQSFANGIESCLLLDADIVVNTDGDNQYCGARIAQLVSPILGKNADIVVGCRDITNHPEFSRFKKFLQWFGSAIVRWLSGTKIPDATSGFRAMNRHAAMRISVMSNFSYTLETLIQAGRIGFRVEWIPVEVNPQTRASRLFRSKFDFIRSQLLTMMGVFLFYCPMRFFGILASIALVGAFFLTAHIAYFLWFNNEAVPKFKTGSGIALLFVLFVIVLCIVCAFLSSVLSGLRILLEDVQFRVRNISMHEKNRPYHLHLVQSVEMGRWKQFKGVVNIDGPVPEYKEVNCGQ
jgi:Glycosyltransferases involved in cell wall biogenesis